MTDLSVEARLVLAAVVLVPAPAALPAVAPVNVPGPGLLAALHRGLRQLQRLLLLHLLVVHDLLQRVVAVLPANVKYYVLITKLPKNSLG